MVNTINTLPAPSPFQGRPGNDSKGSSNKSDVKISIKKLLQNQKQLNFEDRVQKHIDLASSLSKEEVFSIYKEYPALGRRVIKELYSDKNDQKKFENSAIEYEKNSQKSYNDRVSKNGEGSTQFQNDKLIAIYYQESLVQETPTTHTSKRYNTDSFTSTPVSNNGKGLRCGYYALAAGILNLPEKDRTGIFNQIGFREPLKGTVSQDQYSLGDHLFKYSVTNSNSLFKGASQEFFSSMIQEFKSKKSELKQHSVKELNYTISSIKSDINVNSNIFADRLQLLAQHLSLNLRINDDNFGMQQLEDKPTIYVSNPRGVHYECRGISL